MSDTLTTADPLDFVEIPDNLEVPGSYTEIRQVPAADSVTGMPLRGLIVGQISGGSATALTVYKNVSVTDGVALFGAGTALAAAVTAFLTARPYVPLDVVAVAPAAGAAAATGSFTVTTGPSSAGTTAVECNGKRVSFVVTSGMEVADVAAAIAAAWTTDIQQATGCSASAAAGVVTITAREKGQFTNDLDLRVSALGSDQVSGLGITCAAMTGGTGTPDLTGALALVQNSTYSSIVTCLNDTANLGVLRDEALRRFGAMVARDTLVYFGLRASAGAAMAAVPALNSKWAVALPLYRARVAPWVLAAACGAIGAQSLNTDPARQLRGLALTGLDGLGPDDIDQFPEPVRNSLLLSGCSTVTVGAGGGLAIERLVTTYTLDADGGQDLGWQDVMIPATVARVRYDWNSFVTATWPRAKLADDGSPLAQTTTGNTDAATQVVTPSTLKGSWAGRYTLYANTLGWLDDAGTYAAQAQFWRNASNRNRVDSHLPIRVMGSLIVLANIIMVES
ncbi:MAG: phage tail protein [Gluconacetobacter sp.]